MGDMGLSVGIALLNSKIEVLTNLDGRSKKTIKNAKSNNIKNVTLSDLINNCYIILSIIPPSASIELSNKLSENVKYNIEFYKVDIDNNEEFSEKCDIRSVPTFYIMNGKNILSQCSGANIEIIGEMIINTFNTFNKKLLEQII